MSKIITTIAILSLNIIAIRGNAKTIPSAIGRRSARLLIDTETVFDTLTTDQKQIYANHMFTIILSEFGNFIDEFLDPILLEDQRQPISYKPLFLITYYGELNLTKGYASKRDGEFKRNGNVTLTYSKRILTNKVPVKLTKLGFFYEYSVSIYSLGPYGQVEGNAIDIEVYFAYEINFETMTITLIEFTLVKIGNISVWFKGNFLIDWLFTLLSPIVTYIIQDTIMTTVEVTIRDSLIEAIDNINNQIQLMRPKPSIE